MFTNPEQFASATRTLFDLQMQTFNTLASKTVKGVEQVVALNIATARGAAAGTLAAGKELSEAKDPKAALAAMSAQVQPGMDGAAAYREQLKVIIEEMKKEFREAADAHTAETKNTLSALIYDLTENVKPGSENAVQIMKAAIDNAFVGYEKVSQATRDAVKKVEEQIAKASSLVAPGMGKPPAAE